MSTTTHAASDRIDEPLILEVAVNGGTNRREHPRVPITPQEIVADARACAAAGASVIHVHGRRPDGAWAFDDADAHREAFSALRRDDGLLVYPSMMFTRDDPAARFRHVDQLGAEGLLDWAPVDTGTTVLIPYKDGHLAARGFTYDNPIADNRHALALCVQHRLAPSVAAYEPHFIRQLLLLLPEFPGIRPAVLRFMFGGDRLPFGFPADPVFVDAYVHLLGSSGLPWMAACYGGDVLPIAEHVIRRGGHLRVGLEDDASDPARGNVERVQEIAALARRLGRRLATPDDARRLTGA
jgi:3-keto-5-aminohexanoate cleavage enzyme